jgi:thiazolylpeptide-type bacteriocin precursor
MPDLRSHDRSIDALDIDLGSLEISDFVDEERLADTDVVSKVMSASCTGCECCCSCSS